MSALISPKKALRQSHSYKVVMDYYKRYPKALRPSDFIRRGWTSGSFARSHDGKRCEALDKEAVSWCIYGAAIMTSPDDFSLRCELEEAIEELCQRNFGLQPAAWNDEPGQSQEAVLVFLEYYGL